MQIKPENFREKLVREERTIFIIILDPALDTIFTLSKVYKAKKGCYINISDK